MTTTTLKAVDTRRIVQAAVLKWVAIGLMRVTPTGQRELKQYRVDALVANFDLDQLGTPTVNKRDGSFWIIDGQHRIEALRGIGWGDQQIQCWVYEGLTEEQECEKFLKLNDMLAISAHDKFRIGVNAGREMPALINKVVAAEGLHIGTAKSPGTISAVGTLVRVFERGGKETLGRTLRIVRDSFGDPGMQALVIDGIGHLCDRYADLLDEETAIKKLGGIHAGAAGLLGRGALIHQKYGQPRAHCVAAAASEIINTGRGGKKLPSYWRET